MTQRTVRRFAAAAALAAILFTAAAPAQARDLGAAPRAWLWLQDFWTKGVSFLWSWGATPAPAAHRDPGDLRKEGYGLDPNGSPSPSSGSTAPTTGTSGDQGNGLDPNG
jgi:hypothetical protein